MIPYVNKLTVIAQTSISICISFCIKKFPTLPFLMRVELLTELAAILPYLGSYVRGHEKYTLFFSHSLCFESLFIPFPLGQVLVFLQNPPVHLFGGIRK